MSNTMKLARQQHSKERLETQLVSGVKRVKVSNFAGIKKDQTVQLSPADKERIKKEIKILDDALHGVKKVNRKRKQPTTTIQQTETEKTYIDIYSVSYGYTKRTVRKKNKGKSRKKMKRVKSLTLLRSIIAQPGAITAFREGRMGISPKHHVFKLRTEEITNY